MIKILMAALLFIQSSFGFAQTRVGLNDSLAGSASIINSVADYQSFLNLMGILNGQSDQIEKIKAKTDKISLKRAMPKAHIDTDGSLMIGKNKFSIEGETLFLDGKRVPFDSSKTFIENYELIERTFSQKSSAHNLFISVAYADDGFVMLIGVGLLIWSIGEKSVLPWLAGLLLVLHSRNAKAADGIIPLQTCEQKNGAIRSSFQNLHQELFTHDQKLDPLGNLVVTVKRNGEVEQTMTFAKKGDKYSVVGTIDGKGKKVDKLPESAAAHAFKTFAECNDPKLRQLKVKSADEIRKLIASGDIKLAEDKLRAIETKESSAVK